MSTESLRAVRDHLSEVIDRVEHRHERVVVVVLRVERRREAYRPM